MAEALEAMDALFRPMIKASDASDYVVSGDGFAHEGDDDAATVVSEAAEVP